MYVSLESTGAKYSVKFSSADCTDVEECQIRVTLGYTDIIGASGSSQVIFNKLDLTITSAVGDVFTPTIPANTLPGTIRTVYITSMESNMNYTATVSATLLYSAQAFSLVITGDVSKFNKSGGSGIGYGILRFFDYIYLRVSSWYRHLSLFGKLFYGAIMLIVLGVLVSRLISLCTCCISSLRACCQRRHSRKESTQHLHKDTSRRMSPSRSSYINNMTVNYPTVNMFVPVRRPTTPVQDDYPSVLSPLTPQSEYRGINNNSLPIPSAPPAPSNIPLINAWAVSPNSASGKYGASEQQQ